jgi:hypothetical protein
LVPKLLRIVCFCDPSKEWQEFSDMSRSYAVSCKDFYVHAFECGPKRCLTVKEVEIGRTNSMQGGYEDCIHNFSRKPEGKWSFARCRRRQILKNWGVARLIYCKIGSSGWLL